MYIGGWTCASVMGEVVVVVVVLLLLEVRGRVEALVGGEGGVHPLGVAIDEGVVVERVHVRLREVLGVLRVVVRAVAASERGRKHVGLRGRGGQHPVGLCAGHGFGLDGAAAQVQQHGRRPRHGHLVGLLLRDLHEGGVVGRPQRLVQLEDLLGLEQLARHGLEVVVLLLLGRHHHGLLAEEAASGGGGVFRVRGEAGQLLVEVLLQPQRRVDVRGRRLLLRGRLLVEVGRGELRGGGVEVALLTAAHALERRARTRETCGNDGDEASDVRARTLTFTKRRLTFVEVRDERGRRVQRPEERPGAVFGVALRFPQRQELKQEIGQSSSAERDPSATFDRSLPSTRGRPPWPAGLPTPALVARRPDCVSPPTWTWPPAWGGRGRPSPASTATLPLRGRPPLLHGRRAGQSYLEEDGVLRVSPEVRDRIPAVTATGQDLQPPGALSVGARLPCKETDVSAGQRGIDAATATAPCLTLLLLARLVADGGSEVDLVASGQGAAQRAHEDAQTRLLEDVHVVVVGVPHGPARRVSLRLFAGRGVNQPTMAVRPLLPAVELAHLRQGAL